MQHVAHMLLLQIDQANELIDALRAAGKDTYDTLNDRRRCKVRRFACAARGPFDQL